MIPDGFVVRLFQRGCFELRSPAAIDQSELDIRMFRSLTSRTALGGLYIDDIRISMLFVLILMEVDCRDVCR